MEGKMRHLADCNKSGITVLLEEAWGSSQPLSLDSGAPPAIRFERGKVGKDCVVALFTARYCRKPQAFELGVESRQAVGLAINEGTVALFQGLVAELHAEELGQVGKVHLQEVVLLEILEFGANGKELDDAASLVTPEPLCWVGFRVDLRGSIHCPRGGNLASHRTSFLSSFLVDNPTGGLKLGNSRIGDALKGVSAPPGETQAALMRNFTLDPAELAIPFCVALTWAGPSTGRIARKYRTRHDRGARRESGRLSGPL